jgi:hypothetical protein
VAPAAARAGRLGERHGLGGERVVRSLLGGSATWRPEERGGDGALLAGRAWRVQTVVADLAEVRRRTWRRKRRTKSTPSRVTWRPRTARVTCSSVTVRDAVVGEGDAASVAGEVAGGEGCVASGGGLDVDDPADAAASGVAECASEPCGVVVGGVELAGGEGVGEAGAEVLLEPGGEESVRKQERVAAGPPGAAGEAASGDEGVDMGVVTEVGGPGVQDGRDAEPGAVALASEVLQDGGGGVEHRAVDEGIVAQGDGPQLAREGEDDLEVRDWQHPPLLRFEPLGAGAALTLCTVAVPARVVPRPRPATVVAHRQVAAERCRSARQQPREDHAPHPRPDRGRRGTPRRVAAAPPARSGRSGGAVVGPATIATTTTTGEGMLFSCSTDTFA